MNASEGTDKSNGTFLFEHDDDPHRLARLNIESYARNFGGRLGFWKGEWLRYRNARWQIISTSDLQAKLTAFIRREFEASHKSEFEEWEKSGSESPPPKIRKVTRSIVADTLAAMESLCLISSNVDLPCWLPDRSVDVSCRPVRNYVAHADGILDLDRVWESRMDANLPISSDWFSLSTLNYSFDPNATCRNWCQYLSEVLTRDRINILQEFAGYLLTPDTSFQKWLALEGKGGIGKSVFFTGLRAMLGSHNISNVRLDQFGQRFILGSTIGKMLNISADLGKVTELAEGQIKMFTGSDFLSIDRKHKDPISVRATAKLIVSWNERPAIHDRTNSMWRRMILIPFGKNRSQVIPSDKVNREMVEEKYWMEEAPGILNWAILGLIRLKTQKKFSVSESSEEELDHYREDSNPALKFLMANVVIQPDCDVRVKDLYDTYRAWCNSTGNQPLSASVFGREVFSAFPDATKYRPGTGLSRSWVYRGLRLDQDAINDGGGF